ncbi:hypothetical protein HD554DRAFT_2326555 [Boletus coccyginus]|nr:hypothetical protein HD554DRAFT_2326555 [Boletus coccyginus]
MLLDAADTAWLLGENDQALLSVTKHCSNIGAELDSEVPGHGCAHSTWTCSMIRHCSDVGAELDSEALGHGRAHFIAKQILKIGLIFIYRVLLALSLPFFTAVASKFTDNVVCPHTSRYCETERLHGLSTNRADVTVGGTSC